MCICTYICIYRERYYLQKPYPLIQFTSRVELSKKIIGREKGFDSNEK